MYLSFHFNSPRIVQHENCYRTEPSFVRPSARPFGALFRFSNDWNAIRWEAAVLWWLQVISMTGFIIYIGFYQKWHRLASTFGISVCNAYVYRVCVWVVEPLYHRHHLPAWTWIAASAPHELPHTRRSITFIIRSKLLSNSLLLLYFDQPSYSLRLQSAAHPLPSHIDENWFADGDIKWEKYGARWQRWRWRRRWIR